MNQLLKCAVESRSMRTAITDRPLSAETRSSARGFRESGKETPHGISFFPVLDFPQDTLTMLMNAIISPLMTAPPHDLFPYFRTLAELPCPVDWRAFFGNDRPVELDIGCGRGMFLFNAGSARPDHNYLGIELEYTEGRRGAKRLQKRAMDHVRVIGGDAKEFLRKYAPAHSVAAAHVYFPDPWWKRKHKKRRLFNDEFADLLARVVQPGGLVHSWTDVEEYFGVISGLMNHHPDFEALSIAPLSDPAHDMDYQTSFHRRRAQAGCTIYRAAWRRREISAGSPEIAKTRLAPGPG